MYINVPLEFKELTAHLTGTRPSKSHDFIWHDRPDVPTEWEACKTCIAMDIQKSACHHISHYTHNTENSS